MANYNSGNAIPQELRDYNLNTLLPVTTIDQIYNTYDDTNYIEADDLKGVDLMNFYTWHCLGSNNAISDVTNYSLVIVKNTDAETSDASFAKIDLQPNGNNTIICGDGVIRTITNVISFQGSEYIDISEYNDDNIQTISLKGAIADFASALGNLNTSDGDKIVLFTPNSIDFVNLSDIRTNIYQGDGIIISDDGVISIRYPHSEVSENIQGFELGTSEGELVLTVPSAIDGLAQMLYTNTDTGFIKYTDGVFSIEDVEGSGFDVNFSSSNQYYLTGIENPSSSDTTESSNNVTWGCSTTVYTSGGALFCASDERYKIFTDPVEIDFDKLATISKSKFYWKNDETQQINIGVSAQEVAKVYPEIVSQDNITGALSVSYDKLAVIALAAVDKLNERLNVVESKLNELYNKLN